MNMDVKKENKELPYRYRKDVFVKQAGYFKTCEKVYAQTSADFTFDKVDYEIREEDIKFLEEANLNISHSDFEIIIDVFEKLVKIPDSEKSL